MNYGKFKLDYELTDYGKLLFDFDGNLNGMEMSPQRRKAMLSNPAFYFMVAPVFVMVIWFIASLIANSIKLGFLPAVGLHISGFFTMFVMSLILLLSAFGGWGKFMRLASRGKVTGIKEFNASEREKEEILRSKRSSIQIYEEWLVITNCGWTEVYDLSMLEKVKLESNDEKNKSYLISFIATTGEKAYSAVNIPREATLIIQLKKIFKDKLDIRNRVVKKRAIEPINKPIGTLIGLTFFVLIFILAGVGVILMHYYIEPSIPVFLGAFFIVGGCIALCGVYDFIPALKDVLVPILFGSVFIFFPICLVQLIVKQSDAGLTIKQMFGIFNPISAAALFFCWLGLILIYVGIKNIIDYIRYRDKNK
ncbi:MAG: hypothetical protein K2M75_06015 [Clostridia bacterium]|nr:hypothetical protein [Clostridia bacterium]